MTARLKTNTGTDMASQRPVSSVSRARSSGSWLEADILANAPPVPTFLPIFPRSLVASSLTAPPNSDTLSEHLKSPAIDAWAKSVATSSSKGQDDVKSRCGAFTDATSEAGEVWLRPGEYGKWSGRWRPYKAWIAIAAGIVGLAVVLVVALLVARNRSSESIAEEQSDAGGPATMTLLEVGSASGQALATSVVTLTESGRAGGTVVVVGSSILSGTAVSSLLLASPSLLSVIATPSLTVATSAASRSLTTERVPSSAAIDRAGVTRPAAPPPPPPPAVIPPPAPRPANEPLLAAPAAVTAQAIENFSYVRAGFER